MTYKLHEGTLFSYSAGVLCGVLVKESVMKKLVKLQTKHLEDVKRILSDGADKGEVFPKHWTLHYPNGVQTIVNFIDTSRDIKTSIRCATTGATPERKELVFIAKSMQEAEDMADARILQTVTT